MMFPILTPDYTKCIQMLYVFPSVHDFEIGWGLKIHFLFLLKRFTMLSPGAPALTPPASRIQTGTASQAEFHFTERPEYLRSSGVLDESDARDPKAPGGAVDIGGKAGEWQEDEEL